MRNFCLTLYLIKWTRGKWKMYQIGLCWIETVVRQWLIAISGGTESTRHFFSEILIKSPHCLPVDWFYYWYGLCYWLNPSSLLGQVLPVLQWAQIRFIQTSSYARNIAVTSWMYSCLTHQRWSVWSSFRYISLIRWLLCVEGNLTSDLIDKTIFCLKIETRALDRSAFCSSWKHRNRAVDSQTARQGQRDIDRHRHIYVVVIFVGRTQSHPWMFVNTEVKYCSCSVRKCSPSSWWTFREMSRLWISWSALVKWGWRRSFLTKYQSQSWWSYDRNERKNSMHLVGKKEKAYRFAM